MNNNKILLWIDDDEWRMNEIIAYVFPKLWEEKIRSAILIMGDHAEGLEGENFDHDERVRELNRIIYDRFVSYVVDNEIYDDNGFREAEKLVKKRSSENDSPLADVAVNGNSIIASADAKEKCGADDRNSAEEICGKVKGIITDICGKKLNDKDLYIAIDLFLLKSDDDIKENTDKTILSMYLYDCFNKLLKDRVFLFSSYSSPTDYAVSWVENYARKFLGENTDEAKKNIRIFDRHGEMIDSNDRENDNSNDDETVRGIVDIIKNGGEKNDK